MKIRVYNRQRVLAVKPQQVRALVGLALSALHCAADEVAIHLVSTAKITALHSEYFRLPTPTDCISFPIPTDSGDPYQLLGDVFVCPETAVRYAASHGLNPYEELSLYILHGLLHLVGYEDETPLAKRRMRRAEKRLLRLAKASQLLLV